MVTLVTYYDPPTEVSMTEHKLRVQDMEAILRAVDAPYLEEIHYPPKIVGMKDGSKILVRQATREEAPEVLKAIRLYIDINKDFYDIVAWRTYRGSFGVEDVQNQRPLPIARNTGR